VRGAEKTEGERTGKMDSEKPEVPVARRNYLTLGYRGKAAP